jgi:hypothetical protein
LQQGVKPVAALNDLSSITHFAVKNKCRDNDKKTTESDAVDTNFDSDSESVTDPVTL